jgi:hypothetical protein
MCDGIGETGMTPVQSLKAAHTIPPPYGPDNCVGGVIAYRAICKFLDRFSLDTLFPEGARVALFFMARDASAGCWDAFEAHAMELVDNALMGSFDGEPIGNLQYKRSRL